VPAATLLVHAAGARVDLAALSGMTGRSVALAASAAILVALIGFAVGWANRRLAWWQAWSRSATALGYSVPALVAVGITSLLPWAIGSVALLPHPVSPFLR
jgi:ABC-type Fe3+ transport system permease subunit